MDGEANIRAPRTAPLPSQPASIKIDLSRPINPYSNPSRSFTTTSSSSSPPGLLRQFQAAFKRHRPLGTMQSNNIKPRRILVPQRETSKSSVLYVGSAAESRQTQHDSSVQTKNTPLLGETHEDASITLPSSLGTITNVHVENFKPFDLQSDLPRNSTGHRNNDMVSSSLVEAEHVQVGEGQKKVQFAVENDVKTRETEWEASNQLEASTAVSHDMEHHNFQSVEVDFNLRSECEISSSSAKRSTGFLNQVHIQSDFSQPLTQSSVVGSSCGTTTMVNLSSAPMLNSTTHCSHPHQSGCSRIIIKSLGDVDVNSQAVAQLDMLQPSNSTAKDINEPLAYHTDTASQANNTAADTQIEVKEYGQRKCKQSKMSKNCNIKNVATLLDDKSTKGNVIVSDVNDVQFLALLSKVPSPNVNLEHSKPKRHEKKTGVKGAAVHRKRNYDPDLFFKVNGKLYQRLGKIGSGGSGEVHKVISSDCLIYALKKIKLKGRDYATAQGFARKLNI